MATVKDVLERAEQYEASGQLEEAERFYQVVIDRMPATQEAAYAKKRLDAMAKSAEVAFDLEALAGSPREAPVKQPGDPARAPRAKPLGKTKTCKRCGEVLPKGAKVCPRCGARQKGQAKWIILGVVALFLIIGIAGGGGSSSGSSSGTSISKEESTSSTSSDKTATSANHSKEATKTYESVDIHTMLQELNNNAASAKDKYKDKYITVSGKLSNIDSDLQYIDVEDPNDTTYSLVDLQCYIYSNAVREKVKGLSKDQTVTIKGKVTDVGEVLGYSITLEDIQ